MKIIILALLFSLNCYSLTSVYTQYTSSNLTTSPTTLIASTGDITRSVSIFDSSGIVIILVVTPPGASAQNIYLPPGGVDMEFPYPKGTSIAIKTVSGTISTGVNILTVN